jgi:hypothetical protein
MGTLTQALESEEKARKDGDVKVCRLIEIYIIEVSEIISQQMELCLSIALHSGDSETRLLSCKY